MHNVFSTSSVVDAELDLITLTSAIESAFMRQQNCVLLKELNDLVLKDEQLKELLSELSVSEVLNYIQALRNAVSHELRGKNKDLTVADLEITLL